MTVFLKLKIDAMLDNSRDLVETILLDALEFLKY
jgi:hypothetical protein